MTPPLHHYIRPGIVQFMVFPATMQGTGPILESYKHILADPYFEVIEVTAIKDATTRSQARDLLASAGVDVKYGAYPRQLTRKLDLNSANTVTRAHAVAEMKIEIDEASLLGARDVGFLSGWDVTPSDRPAAMDRLVDSISELCAHAAGKNIRLALEVFDRDIDKKCLIGPAATARDVAERVKKKHPNFGLIVDLGHTVLLGESPREALLPVRDHLVHAHIGNAYFGPDRDDPYWGDNHPSFGYPGSPNDVPQIIEFLQTLFEIGYLQADGSQRATLSFEMKPVGSIDPIVMIANAKRKLAAAWSALTL